MGCTDCVDQEKQFLVTYASNYKSDSRSKDNFVMTAQPHLVYELTAIYGFLNVSADTDKNKLYIASSILKSIFFRWLLPCRT